MAHFYLLCETISPTLAWGFLGTNTTLKEQCLQFRVREAQEQCSCSVFRQCFLLSLLFLIYFSWLALLSSSGSCSGVCVWYFLSGLCAVHHCPHASWWHTPTSTTHCSVSDSGIATAFIWRTVCVSCSVECAAFLCVTLLCVCLQKMCSSRNLTPMSLWMVTSSSLKYGIWWKCDLASPTLACQGSLYSILWSHQPGKPPRQL